MLQAGRRLALAMVRPSAKVRRQYRRIQEERQPRAVAPAVWRRLYSDRDDPGLFREWLRVVTDPDSAADFTRSFATSSLRFDIGVLTRRYLELFSRDCSAFDDPDRKWTSEEISDFDREQNVCDRFIHTETLTDDLLKVMREAGYSLSAEVVQTLRTMGAQKSNASVHKPYAAYYDAASVELVARSDRLVIEKYGYPPPVL
jgi:hypothetical protein